MFELQAGSFLAAQDSLGDIVTDWVSESFDFCRYYYDYNNFYDRDGDRDRVHTYYFKARGIFGQQDIFLVKYHIFGALYTFHWGHSGLKYRFFSLTVNG